MDMGLRWRSDAVLTAVLLTTAGCTGSTLASAGDRVGNIESAAHRLAGELLDTTASKDRPPLTSDLVHARTIDPVLTRRTAVWLHEALPSPPLTVLGGRVFTYRDVTYDPLDAPVLKLRPTDDDQVIPLVVRVVIDRGPGQSAEATLTLSIPAPPIFEPRLEGLSVRVGTERAAASIERSLAESVIIVRVPLDGADGAGPLTVIIEGELVLGRYRPSPRGRVADLNALPVDPELTSLATLVIGRDVADEGERTRLLEIAGRLAARDASDAERVVAVTSGVSSLLAYQESAAVRSPIESLEDASGDCDEFSALATALLRALGIPSRVASGLLYDLDILAAHAWVEAALPVRKGTPHWFLADPTLAGATPIEDHKARWVHLKDRILLYPVRPVVVLEGAAGRLTTDVLLNWRRVDERPTATMRELERILDLVIETVDRDISRRAEALAAAGLRLRRASASIAGSPYVIVDRVVAEDASARIQLRLENEERLVLDLTADDETGLDPAAIEQLKAAYDELSNLFFGGVGARHNLELVYLRDRHSDRLHTVSLRIGRYLVEHELARILGRLAKADLLTEGETARISAVAEASGRRNLYLLQELARGAGVGK